MKKRVTSTRRRGGRELDENAVARQIRAVFEDYLSESMILLKKNVISVENMIFHQNCTKIIEHQNFLI